MRYKIEEKIINGQRISDEECLFLFYEHLPYLGKLASIAKKRFHDNEIATFIIDVNINITNICSSECGFCAFHQKKHSDKAFVLSRSEIMEKIRNLVSIGGTQVLLQGGINEDLDLDYYVSLLKIIKSNFNVYIHSFSPAEIYYLAEKEKMTVKEILITLREAGLDSLPGGGAEILSDRVRGIISPKKISKLNWLNVMRDAHDIGMETTATMMFGSVETHEERIEHLRAIRDLQDQTGGFRALIPWTFCPQNTQFENIITAGGGEYLKMLAISRIYLDNIKNIGSGWLTEGMKVAQIGLLFGANDMGGILIEEKVLQSTGLQNRTNISELKKVISGAGYVPAKRNTKYELLEIYS